MPQGQTSCLMLKDMNGDPLGTLYVEVEKMTVECQRKSEFFTRSYQMKHQAIKRCSGAGSCTGDKYEKITSSSKVSELNGEPNDHPGSTHCLESCGCWGCKCFLCSSACLFYRVYGIPSSQNIFEVFSCPLWQYKIIAKIKLELSDKSDAHEFVLRPGVEQSYGGIKIALISATSPPVPMLGTNFLTDRSRTVMIKTAASGQPVAGMVGDLQRGTRAKAENFDCFMANNLCQCEGRESYVMCSCINRQLEDLFMKAEYVLPLTSQGINVISTEKGVEAEFQNVAALEIQVSMEGVRFSTKIDKSKCTIRPESFMGCYACLTGGKLSYECKAEFGDVVAHIVCGQGSFSTRCNEEGVKSTASMAFSKAKIKETCEVSCPGGVTHFEIEATLVYIEKQRIGNITNMIAGKSNGGSGIDFGFLTGWLSGNWIASLIILVVVIIIILITIPHLPVFVQWFSAKLKTLFTKGSQQSPNIKTLKTSKLNQNAIKHGKSVKQPKPMRQLKKQI